MRIVFMGTPEFAVASLEALLEHNFEVVAVVTAPDKPAGRGLKVNQSAVKHYAMQRGLRILQPEKLKDPNFIQTLKNLKADVHIVVAFRMLPEIVWNMPPLGTFNLHASLLPKYRGAAPINWAIIQGEKETGVTTFKLQHEIDTGLILHSKSVVIGSTTTAGELHDILKVAGANLLVSTLQEIESSVKEHRSLNFQQQQEEQVSHAPKLHKEDCRIDWNQTGIELYNRVRGLSPSPAAFTFFKLTNGELKSVKLFKVTFEPLIHKNPNGLLNTDNKTILKVYCNGGLINIESLQMEGKKRMQIAEFLRGIKPGSLLLCE